SSRRRHTRFSRDWSSDVCSSDLLVLKSVSEIVQKLMYSKEEAKRLKERFWTNFGQFMSLVPNEEGVKVNWVNYKTGIKHLYFRKIGRASCRERVDSTLAAE